MPSTHPLYPVLLSTGSTLRFYYHLWYSAEVGGSASVCVCLCMCVCECECECVCVCVSECVWVFLCVFECIYECAYVSDCVWVSLYLSLGRSVSVSFYVYVGVCVSVHLLQCVGMRTPRVLILGHITGLLSSPTVGIRVCSESVCSTCEWRESYITSYLCHPENLIRKAIRSLPDPLDPYETSIRRNFRRLFISIRTKIMVRNHIKKWSGVSNSWSGTRFHWSGEKMSVFRMTEVGRYIGIHKKSSTKF